MGLCFSGEIADLVLFRLSETRFLENSKHVLRSYSRFKDDVFVIFKGNSLACHRWFQDFEKTCSNVFRLKLEQISETSVDVLDLTVFKGARWVKTGHLDTKPFFKPSHRGAVLGSSSSHPRTVHASWPISRFCTFDSLSSSPHYAVAAKKQFMAHLGRQDPCHPSLPTLQSSLCPVRTGRPARRQPGTWVVLPYHPALLCVQGVVHAIAAHWQYLARVYDRKSLGLLSPQISWCRGNKFLTQLLTLGTKREE